MIITKSSPKWSKFNKYYHQIIEIVFKRHNSSLQKNILIYFLKT